jgi:hypothetical protein
MYSLACQVIKRLRSVDKKNCLQKPPNKHIKEKPQNRQVYCLQKTPQPASKHQQRQTKKSRLKIKALVVVVLRDSAATTSKQKQTTHSLTKSTLN